MPHLPTSSSPPPYFCTNFRRSTGCEAAAFRNSSRSASSVSLGSPSKGRIKMPFSFWSSKATGSWSIISTRSSLRPSFERSSKA